MNLEAGNPNAIYNAVLWDESSCTWSGLQCALPNRCPYSGPYLPYTGLLGEKGSIRLELSKEAAKE